MSTDQPTYRERREQRAERLREWGEKRQQDARPMYETAHARMSMIPLGEPIHSAQDYRRRQRMANAVTRAFEHGRKGDEMVARADAIEAQAAGAIYSDDADATERLDEKIARLEAERERIKAYNASCRKAAKTDGVGDLTLLDESQRQDIASTIRVGFAGLGGAFPSYALSNLGGNIKRLRDRLKQLDAPPVDRIITARFDSECATCSAQLTRGDQIRYSKQAGARCVECAA